MQIAYHETILSPRPGSPSRSSRRRARSCQVVPRWRPHHRRSGWREPELYRARRSGGQRIFTIGLHARKNPLKPQLWRAPHATETPPASKPRPRHTSALAPVRGRTALLATERAPSPDRQNTPNQQPASDYETAHDHDATSAAPRFGLGPTQQVGTDWDVPAVVVSQDTTRHTSRQSAQPSRGGSRRASLGRVRDGTDRSCCGARARLPSRLVWPCGAPLTHTVIDAAVSRSV